MSGFFFVTEPKASHLFATHAIISFRFCRIIRSLNCREDVGVSFLNRKRDGRTVTQNCEPCGKAQLRPLCWRQSTIWPRVCPPASYSQNINPVMEDAPWRFFIIPANPLPRNRPRKYFRKEFLENFGNFLYCGHKWIVFQLYYGPQVEKNLIEKTCLSRSKMRGSL